MKQVSVASARRPLLIVAAAAVVLNTTGARASTNWVGGINTTSTSFNNPRNWSAGVVPGAGETLIFDNANAYSDAAVDYTLPLTSNGSTNGYNGILFAGQNVPDKMYRLNDGKQLLIVEKYVLNSSTTNQTINSTLYTPIHYAAGSDTPTPSTVRLENTYENSGMTFNDVTLNYGDTLLLRGPAFSTIRINGTIRGSGTLVNDYDLTTVLSGSNTFGGGILINGGTVQFATGPNLGATTNTVTFDRTNGYSVPTLARSASGTTVGGFVLKSTGESDLSADAAWTHSGTVSGAGMLGKRGEGSLKLTGALSYTGGTTVYSGTLEAATALPTGAVVVEPDTTESASLVISANNVISQLSGAGNVTVNAGSTLTIRDNKLTAGFHGGGAVAFGYGDTSKPSTVKLNYASDHTGGTVVTPGTTLVSAAGAGVYATGTGPVDVQSGGSLVDGDRFGVVTVRDNASFVPGSAAAPGKTEALLGGLSLAGANGSATLGLTLSAAPKGTGGVATTDSIKSNGAIDVSGGRLRLTLLKALTTSNGFARTRLLGGSSVTGKFAGVDRALGADAGYPAWSVAVTYSGDSVYAQSAAFGDASLNGTLDPADVLAMAPGYDKQGGYSWVDGDFDGDGFVTYSDLYPLATGITRELSTAEFAQLYAQSQPLWTDYRTIRGLPVPEPTALSFLAVAAVGLTRRSRRGGR